MEKKVTVQAWRLEKMPVIIGEGDNVCTLTPDGWNELKTLIKKGDL